VITNGGRQTQTPHPISFSFRGGPPILPKRGAEKTVSTAVKPEGADLRIRPFNMSGWRLAPAHSPSRPPTGS